MIWETRELSYLCIHNAYRIIYQSGLNTTEALKKIEDEFEKNQGVFLSIPKSDIKFFKELAKKMGWDIDIREDFLKDYIASRPKRVNLSEEEILAELNAIRYEKWE